MNRTAAAPTTCRHCGATNVQWAESKSSKSYLQDTVTWTGDRESVQRVYGRGPHFKTCDAQRAYRLAAIAATRDPMAAHEAGQRYVRRAHTVLQVVADGIKANGGNPEDIMPLLTRSFAAQDRIKAAVEAQQAAAAQAAADAWAAEHPAR